MASAFDYLAGAGNVLGVAMQIPDVLAELTAALAAMNEDPAAAAEVPDVVRAWEQAAPETRAGILMSAAWGAGRGDAPQVPEAMHSHVAGYVEDLHGYAAAHKAEDSEAFHGAAFPAMPLPGQAGALATSLAFDRDDLPISLATALVLLAASRAVAPGGAAG